VVVPLVNSVAEAELAVKWTKYPPVGARGVSPRKASDYGRQTAQYLRKANEETVVVGQVETREALDNLDSILSLEQLDVAFVGPSDLTMSLGLVDDRSSPVLLEAMKRVVAKCQEHRKAPGVMAASPAEAKRAVEMGFRFVSLSSDQRHLQAGAMDFLASVGRL
jgi:2-keto-3-deoxy-L-rhamnonate aldolase RhmA